MKNGQSFFFDNRSMISENLGISGTKIILNKDTSIVRRSLWLLLVLSMTGVMIWQIIKRLETFFSHPLAVNVEIQYEKYLRFPVIVLCNENTVTVSGAYSLNVPNDISKSSNQLNANKDYFAALEEIIMNETKVNETIQWYEEIYGKTNEIVVGKEETERYISSVSHKLSSMLKYCLWQNRECTVNDFKPVTDGMAINQCYAFNVNEIDPLYTNVAGAFGALKLQMDSQQYDYSGSYRTLGAGVSIAILDGLDNNTYTGSETTYDLSAGKLYKSLI